MSVKKFPQESSQLEAKIIKGRSSWELLFSSTIQSTSFLWRVEETGRVILNHRAPWRKPGRSELEGLVLGAAVAEGRGWKKQEVWTGQKGDVAVLAPGMVPGQDLSFPFAKRSIQVIASSWSRSLPS